MCLLAWSLGGDDHVLLLASNRDEFLLRPTEPAHFWDGDEGILAGRDSKKGGTWLGVSKKGRLGFITNYRGLSVGEFSSRGHLVTDFLKSTESPVAYLGNLKLREQEREKYDGFNLVVMDVLSGEMAYLTNRPLGQHTEPVIVTPGIHGLSNAFLDTPWPKVQKVKSLLASSIATLAQPSEIISDILHDKVKCDDVTLLPDTGIGKELEKAFSSIFVRCNLPQGEYGTRSSTVVKIDLQLNVHFYEKFLEDGVWKSHEFHFPIENST